MKLLASLFTVFAIGFAALAQTAPPPPKEAKPLAARPFTVEQKLRLQLLQEKQKNYQTTCYVQNKQAADELQVESAALYADVCKSVDLEAKPEKCQYDQNLFVVGTPAQIAALSQPAKAEPSKK